MIIALHGFLGLPADWDLVFKNKGGQSGADSKDTADVWAVDLWHQLAEIDESSADAFRDWARLFNESVERKFTHARAEDRPTLLGYSMGGRLAIHAMLARPDLYRSAVIVSAHPGLALESERASRRESDERWAERFLSEPWEELIAAWNSQGVLARPEISRSDDGKAIRLERLEREFDRVRLARAMRLWSLGRQEDLRPQLARLQLPILFMSGGEDEKFTRLLSALTLSPFQERQVVPSAGHRLPWDDPDEFRQRLEGFVRKAWKGC